MSIIFQPRLENVTHPQMGGVLLSNTSISSRRRLSVVSSTPTYDSDASNFFARVVTNGGTISDNTKTAVNNFVVSSKANSYWSKINRINLFCGNQLASCLVPLKIGNGSSIDTNNNFVEGDYSESTGLVGNGSTKYLNTGLDAGSSLTLDQSHLAAYNRSNSFGASDETLLGGRDAGSQNFQILHSTFDSKFYAYQYNNTTADGTLAGTYGFIISSKTASNSNVLYRNGTSVATSTTSGGTLPNSSIFVFALDNIFGTPQNYCSNTLASYSIGADLSSTDVSNYNTDMEAFQDALSRGVQ